MLTRNGEENFPVFLIDHFLYISDITEYNTDKFLFKLNLFVIRRSEADVPNQ